MLVTGALDNRRFLGAVSLMIGPGVSHFLTFFRMRYINSELSEMSFLLTVSVDGPERGL